MTFFVVAIKHPMAITAIRNPLLFELLGNRQIVGDAARSVGLAGEIKGGLSEPQTFSRVQLGDSRRRMNARDKQNFTAQIVANAGQKSLI